MGLGAVVGCAALFCAYVQVSGVPTYTPAKPDLHVTVTPEKVERGKRTAVSVCINCHRDPSTGNLSGRPIHDVPEVFGAVVSKNITADRAKGVGAWTDGELAAMVRTTINRDGNFSPFMGSRARIADTDLEDLIAWMRSTDPRVAPVAQDPPGHSNPSFLVKFLTHVAIKPPQYPTAPVVRPPASDPVALGKYLATDLLGCVGCHSEDFKSENHEFPEKTPGFMGGGNQLKSLDGVPIFTANITADDETGIGRWTKEEFRRALTRGIRANQKPVRFPMNTFVALSDDEADAIYAYLRTIPKIQKQVVRWEPPAAGGDPGRTLYVTAACNSCHGDDGIGYFDLRKTNEHFRDDASLQAFIEDSNRVRPLTPMPTYTGIIAAADYAPLIKYVRTLGGH